MRFRLNKTVYFDIFRFRLIGARLVVCTGRFRGKAEDMLRILNVHIVRYMSVTDKRKIINN